MQFKVGDTVKWTSQAGGHAKQKIGTVVREIAPGEDIRDALNKEKLPTDRVEWGGGMRRDETCYIVRVDPGENKKDILYVPRTKVLEDVLLVEQNGVANIPNVWIPGEHNDR